MDIKTSVFWRPARDKKTVKPDGTVSTTQVKGSYVFRIRFTDANGKLCCRERGGFGKGEKNRCKDAMNKMIREIEASGGHNHVGERMTFSELADRCEKEFYKPAVIRDGQKIAGVKSWVSVRAQIQNLRRYFGNRRINAINTESLFAYREDRMKPKAPKKPEGKAICIKAATVNRELAAMRRMMRYAHANGWITRDIFYNAKVIQAALEKPRDRVLSPEEEKRLLSACEGQWTVPYTRVRNGRAETINAKINLSNGHLRAMIVLAIDTGMRRGEILKLRWEDIDLEDGVIQIVSSHTKTERARIVPLSERCKAELLKIKPISKGDRPFPYGGFKRSFATAKRLAGIADLRFHDLRTTAGDRMSRVYPISTVAKILGHTEISTTMKFYVGNELSTVLEVKKWLDASDQASKT
jgi:integrase